MTDDDKLLAIEVSLIRAKLGEAAAEGSELAQFILLAIRDGKITSVDLAEYQRELFRQRMGEEPKRIPYPAAPLPPAGDDIDLRSDAAEADFARTWARVVNNERGNHGP